MVVPNLIFDLIVFGALLIAAVLDFFVPQLAGAATLLAVCGVTYIATQELCEILERRGLWTQESVATAIALSVAIFLYFRWRNSSDLSLLILSVALMMASLMLAIALIASVGAAVRDLSARPLLGLLVILAGSAGLGVLAGLLVTSTRLDITLILLLISFAIWKLRENVRPPASNDVMPAMEESQSTPASHSTPSTSGKSYAGRSPVPLQAVTPVPSPATLRARRALMPERGTLLDRFLPVLVLGALLFIALRQSDPNALWPSQPASASPDNALNISPNTDERR